MSSVVYIYTKYFIVPKSSEMISVDFLMGGRKLYEECDILS